MDIKENEEVNQVKIIYKRKRTFRNRIGSKPMLKVKSVCPNAEIQIFISVNEYQLGASSVSIPKLAPGNVNA